MIHIGPKNGKDGPTKSIVKRNWRGQQRLKYVQKQFSTILPLGDSFLIHCEPLKYKLQCITKSKYSFTCSRLLIKNPSFRTEGCYLMFLEFFPCLLTIFKFFGCNNGNPRGLRKLFSIFLWGLIQCWLIFTGVR